MYIYFYKSQEFTFDLIKWFTLAMNGRSIIQLLIGPLGHFDVSTCLKSLF